MSEGQWPWPEPAWRIEAEQAAKQASAELRDRFAMAALTGLLAAGDAHAYNRDKRAEIAWQEADAMLKARGDA